MTATYVLDVTERAVKTAAQSAVGVLSAGALGVLDVDWAAVGSVAFLAGIVSVLTSIGSTGFGRGNGTASIVPSVVNAETHEVLAPPPPKIDPAA